jgi:16S rRNA A1518/A1519 N6-dimethyltransferase RsmA/KsgA/DIM1 with predicted DNA glycosylase/AP lyase activity
VFSAVVCFTPHAEQPAAALFGQMERLTAAAFGQRRKMLRGALRPLGGETLLRTAGIEPGSAGRDAHGGGIRSPGTAARRVTLAGAFAS